MTSEERSDREGRQAQMLKGLAELALLGLLRGGARYGLDILDQLRKAAGLNLAEGTIYPLLHRLEKAGAVEAQWRIDDDGARPRKYYALTPKGHAQFDDQLAEWRRVSASLSAFLDGDTG